MFWKKKIKNNEYSVVEYYEPQAPVALSPSLKNDAVVPKGVPFPGQDLLTYESSNSYVRIAQLNLIERGYNIPGGANGIYGIATVNAVKEFYTSNDLGSNTGKHIGPKAWNSLVGN